MNTLEAGLTMALLLLLSACSPPGGAPGSGSGDESPAARAQDAANEVKHCDQKAANALVIGLMGGPEVTGVAGSRDGPVILVEPNGWRALGYDRQKQIISLFDCSMAGPHGYEAVIHVRQDRDGPDLIKATDMDLLAWRQEGDAQTSAAPAESN